MKPLFPRIVEIELTEAELVARKQRKDQEKFQRQVMGQRPVHTSLAKRLSKGILVPLSRPRPVNEFLRVIDLLGNVQRARIKLLDDDEAIVKGIDQDYREWIVKTELQRLADGGAREYFMEFEFYF
jgi:hypothetical protein